ncbi:DsrE family protein [Flavitalea sp. BT771]|uniref:DsrE family protein n=1 Tax=Flavitalea sp. BT771 TaxID=3063329 RepID=UPI0026E28B38|nr:DsrE family protein [Flavitalea sp. BT771]MDO6429779.1 DsrE family protein [Flavitalea sp. BT771]MDV6218093.1 DsrE family protein [Flavitalea sp. BT771]
MQKYRLMLFLLLGSLSLAAQRSDYKVVFDLTSRDTVDQKNLVRWLTEISNANPNAKLEVVMYSKGLELVVKDKSYVAEEIGRLSANKNIAFKVCAIAMTNNKISQDQLLTGVEIVPDGIYEIISRQKEGWGYIKAAR